MPRARLSARKYGVAVKALNEMIGNEKIGVVRRLKALDLLLDLYRRYDAMVERKERAQARKEAGLPPEPMEVATNLEPSAEEEARAFIAKMQSRRQATYAVGAEEGVNDAG